MYSHSWEQHVDQLHHLFSQFKEANLTVTLMKSELPCQSNFSTYVGHVLSQGQVAPVTAKIEIITKFLVPTAKRDLMRFLGMAGCYCKFCQY